MLFNLSRPIRRLVARGREPMSLARAFGDPEVRSALFLTLFCATAADGSVRRPCSASRFGLGHNWRRKKSSPGAGAWLGRAWPWLWWTFRGRWSRFHGGRGGVDRVLLLPWAAGWSVHRRENLAGESGWGSRSSITRPAVIFCPRRMGPSSRSRSWGGGGARGVQPVFGNPRLSGVGALLGWLAGRAAPQFG